MKRLDVKLLTSWMHDAKDMNDTNENIQFESKWKTARQKKNREEWTVFVPKGKKPVTQRQFSLYWYSEFMRRTLQGHGYKKGIELGCGRGTAALYMHLYEGMDMTLNDASDDAIELAKKNFDFFGGKANFIVGDSTKLPLSDASFDFIITVGLFEHFSDYRPALRECLRLLRPGGMLVSMNKPRKTSMQILNHLYRACIRPFRDAPLQKDYYRNSDTAEQYVARAKEVGFAEVRSTNINPFPLFVPIFFFLERWIAYFNRTVMFLRGLFIKHPFQTSRIFAESHFLVASKPE